MKRKFCVFVAMVTILSFSGCEKKINFNFGSSNDIEKTTEEFMEAAKNSDVEKMKSLVDDEKAFDDYRPSADEKESDNETEEKMVKTFEEYEDECAKKITYEIKDKNEDEKTVTLKCKYIDSKEFVKIFMNESIKAMAKVPFDSKTKEADLDKAFDTAYENAKKNINDTFIESEVKLDFVEKDDKLKIKEISKDFSKVLTANMEEAFKVAMDAGVDTEPLEEAKKDKKDLKKR